MKTRSPSRLTIPSRCCQAPIQACWSQTHFDLAFWDVVLVARIPLWLENPNHARSTSETAWK